MCMNTTVNKTSTSAQIQQLHVFGPTKPPLTPCHHHRVNYCFNYRQKEKQKEFITTLIGMTPAGLLQGQRGSPSLFIKGVQGLGI